MENKLVITAFIGIVFTTVCSADLYQRQPQGWVWYSESDMTEEAAKNEKSKPSSAVASSASGKSAKETLRQLGEEMEEAEAQSVLNPTTENIQHSMALKKQIMVLTNTYADRLEQVIWKNPDLDYTLERPMRTDSLFAASPVRKEKLYAGLAVASKSNAIVYVFRSDCPYCKKFSPILKAFAEEHGFTVMPISLDGVGNEVFPYPKKDTSVLKAKGMIPQVVPAVYLVNPRKDSVEAVGFGLMNSVDLENRVGLAAGLNIYEGVTSAASR